MFSNEHFTGGEHVIASDLNEFPLLVKGGYPLAMQPYRSRMGSAPLDELVIRVYPGRDGESTSATLYEDDGDTEAYKDGKFAETTLTYSRNGDDVSITVGATAGGFDGQLDARCVCIELPCTSNVEIIESSAPVIAQDCQDGLNRIHLRSTSIRNDISVTLRTSIQDNSHIALSAFKRRAEALFGTATDSSSWQEFPVDEQTEDVRAVLTQLIGKEPVRCIDPIGVGEPFSDPDW
jgi:hypothetical protein